MKQTQTVFKILCIAAFLQWSQLVVAAGEPKELETFEPPAITNEDITKPEVTVIEKDGDTIEEYRVNGQLYMMKVTPKHGKPYYMHKEDQEGGWKILGPNEPLVIPKWTLFRF